MAPTMFTSDSGMKVFTLARKQPLVQSAWGVWLADDG